MIDNQKTQATDTSAEVATPKVKRAPAEVETVTMTDGCEVGFAGKAKMKKEWLADNSGVRFDFRNGQTRTFQVTGSALLAEFACHGASQKIGDEAAGEDDIDDMLVAVDAIISRLEAGEWGKQRASSGDSFSGASVVIRALMEATGKDQTAIKAFLDAKLAGTPGLKRGELYASFRNPNSTVGKIVARLELEKKSKATKVNADEELAALLNG